MDAEAAEVPDLTPWSEQLAGYVGYDSPKARRSSDEAVRATLAVELDELLAHVESLGRHFAASETAEHFLTAAVARRDLLESLSQRIHVPPYVRSLFFTATDLPEEALTRVRRNDRAALLACEEVRVFLEPTLGPDSDFEYLLERLGSLIAELHDIFEERIEAINASIV